MDNSSQNSFQLHLQAVLQIFNSLLLPPGIFQQKCNALFIWNEKKLSFSLPLPTGNQSNQLNYFRNRSNLCISFNNLLDRLCVIEIFHSSTLFIRKHTKPVPSCLSEVWTSENVHLICVNIGKVTNFGVQEVRFKWKEWIF